MLVYFGPGSNSFSEQVRKDSGVHWYAMQTCASSRRPMPLAFEG